MPKQSSRQVAINILDEFAKNKAPLASISNARIESADKKSLCTEFVNGVIRNQTALDVIISACCDIKIKRIHKKLIDIVRLGCYELVYQSGAADHAAINEAVNIAKTIAKQKGANFVNALLRNIQRHIKQKNIPLALAKNIIPTDQNTGTEFDIDLLPDFQTDPDQYLSDAYSQPLWLTQSWLKNHDNKTATDICKASNRRPSTYAIPNILNTSTDDLAKLFTDNEIEFDRHPELDVLKITSHQRINTLPGYDDGLFTIQDITAYNVIGNLPLEKVKLALDLCSAPGGKTVQLAQHLPAGSQIIATDINPARLEKVRQNTDRLKLPNVMVTEYQNFFTSIAPTSKADFILLDVPCSNTGVSARRVDLRHRLTAADIKSLTELQAEILENAIEFLSPRGMICYSTCSIEPVENELMIKKFLKHNRDFTLVFEKLTLPQTGDFACDGGYHALLTNHD